MRSLLGTALVFAVALVVACDGNSATPNGEGSPASPTDGSPRAEVVVVAVNVAQIEGVSDERMAAFADALKQRPRSDGRVQVPDVVVTEEMPAGRLRQLQGMLNERFPAAEFEVAGPVARRFRAKVLINSTENRRVGVRSWVSPCASDYVFPIVELEDLESRARYSVTGIHIKFDASEECKVEDARKLRSATANVPGVAIAAGDFNRRPVEKEKECDPTEESPTIEWWRVITEPSPGEGSRWVDAVREVHGTTDAMADQWTREAEEPVELCDGTTDFRRVRIDYIFVRQEPGMQVLDATVDHPGWAGDKPGTTDCEPDDGCKYSDHRFVWARIAI